MPTHLSTSTREQFDRMDIRDKFFAELAAAGEGLVPDDPSLLEGFKRQTAVAVSGIAMVSALNAAPAAASAPEAPAPIVRIANVAPTTTTLAANKALQPVASDGEVTHTLRDMKALQPVASDGEVTHTLRVMGAEAKIVTMKAATPLEPAADKAALTGQRVVGRGDTLSDIADELGVDLSHLKAANKDDMPNPNLVFSGQVADYDPTLAKPHKHDDLPQVTPEMLKETEEVLIEWGDTLSRYAGERGDPVADIATRNGIPNPNRIYAGEKIRLKPKPPVTFSAASVAAPAAEAALATLTPTPSSPEAVPAPPAVPETVIVETPAASLPTPLDFRMPFIIDTPPPAPEAPPAPPKKPSEIFNVEVIPDMFHGFGGTQIRADIAYLMDTHKLSPNGAAFMSATFLQEAGNDHRRQNHEEGGYGLIQANGDRRHGMETKERNDQINVIFKQMQEGYPQVYAVLTDYNSTPEQVRQALKDFIRYGHEGNRTTWGQQLAYFLHVPRTETPKPTFSVSTANQVVRAATLPAAPAPPPATPAAPPPIQANLPPVLGAVITIEQASAPPVPEARDRYGYVQIPEDPEGRYVFDSFAEPADRWAKPETISFAQEVAINFYNKFPGMQTHFGDFNERERGKHVSHRNGIDVDLDAKGPAGSIFDTKASGYNAAATIEYGKIMLMTGKVELLLFNDPVVIRELNKFAAENNLPGKVQYEDNHWNHAHVRLNTPEGPRVR